MKRRRLDLGATLLPISIVKRRIFLTKIVISGKIVIIRVLNPYCKTRIIFVSYRSRNVIGDA